MIVVDDYLALAAVAGQLPPALANQSIATTYGRVYRLLRAITSSQTSGQLSEQFMLLSEGRRERRHAPRCGRAWHRFSGIRLSSATTMTGNAKTYQTKTGRVLTDADVERLADEVARAEYAVERMHDQTRKL